MSVFTLVAFAANSLLCRMAMGQRFPSISGLLFLSEQFSIRLFESSLLILGGVASYMIPEIEQDGDR